MAADLIRLVEECLSKAMGFPVRIAAAEPIASPHVLIRCHVAGPTTLPPTVIAKQVTTTEFTSSVAGTSGRLLNEWASLEFFAGAPGTPRFIAGDRREGLVIMEDLGAHSTVLGLIEAAHPDAAAATVEIGAGIGRMQLAAHDRLGDFTAIQRRLGTVSPQSDSTKRILGSLVSLADSWTDLGITPPSGVWDDIEAVEQGIHGDGPFRSFLHADAGPQNCLWIENRIHLIDFEFGTMGHGILDVVSARLGFPQSEEAGGVPMPIVHALEERYRAEISPVFTAAGDDAAFGRAIVDAAAHWSLSRWVARWERLFAGPVRSAHPTEAVSIGRSQAMTVFAGFIEAAGHFGHRHSLAAAFAAAVGELQRRIPGLEALPTYPAFR